MYPPEFDYRRADSVEQALDLLAPEDARVLAGGQSMLPELKTGQAAPGTLVDVGNLDSLRGIDVDDGETTVGALTTYAELAASDPLWERTPAVAEAAESVGDLQVRNRGTIGGNLAQADPDGDLPAAAVAADATVVVQGQDGEREIPAAEFFDGGETALGEDELLVRVRVPHADGAYVRKDHPATGYATVGVAAVIELDGGGGEQTDDHGASVAAARVAATGVQPSAVRLESVEEALVDDPPTDEVVERAAGSATADLDRGSIPGDPYVSSEFRASLLEQYVEHAIERAVARASGGDSR